MTFGKLKVSTFFFKGKMFFHVSLICFGIFPKQNWYVWKNMLPVVQLFIIKPEEGLSLADRFPAGPAGPPRIFNTRDQRLQIHPSSPRGRQCVTTQQALAEALTFKD